MRGTLEERLWAKVEKTDTCWLWTAGRDSENYGRIYAGSRSFAAHRIAYELLVGPIPEGLEIDHKCRVRYCVNPEHLEPVTHRENMRRGVRGILTTHCPHGHPYDETNTYLYRGRRCCRACNRAAAARLKAFKKGIS